MTSPHTPIPAPIPSPSGRPENSTAAYALARLRRPRVATEEGLVDYEELLRVRVCMCVRVSLIILTLFPPQH
jgi:hypothetical protein